MRSMRGIASPVVIVVAAAVTAALPLAPPPAAAGGGGPRAWLTTGDQANLLSERSDLITAPDTAAPVITIDAAKTYQTVAGFGASITDSSAHLLARSPRRDAVMRDLFDPRRGLGLSYLRQPMGASDFVAGPHYTYDDMPAGQRDYRLTRFSIAHDQAEILPLLRQARALNPSLKVMATPWSPPAWMKTNGSLVGGRLIDDPRVYRAYADYFVRFVQAYRRAGVPIDAITLQNEPQNRTPSGYPGMDLRPDEEIRLAELVGRRLRAAGLKTKILGYDHNWSLHPNDVGPPDDPADPEYAMTVMNDARARRYLAGTAYHCYFGDPARQSALQSAHPDKDVYFTECSGSLSQNPATTFPDTLHWQTAMLTVGAMRNWSKTVITWNLALDPAGGPHNGGCDTCFGVVTIDPATGAVTRTADYYVLGHATRFVRPGAVRIDSTVAGTIADVAFRNPDGSIAVIVVNDDWGTGSQRFTVRKGDTAFSYELPAGAVVTFTLR
ncbi:MAG TPA: glycoside hydrolase family 30 beta sandwich domain-containing protein [Streptosporangiaceae bacterium]|nr:glycoside hydrolase family 30 beta sandwich domain-containing protein [Streptosporangiaceae bacterium]